MAQPYRWSPAVEARFLDLARVGANAVLIAEQLGCLIGAGLAWGMGA